MLIVEGFLFHAQVCGNRLMNNRFTVWATKTMAPALSVHTVGTSFDEVGVKNGCKELLKVWDSQSPQGKTDIKAVYIDNPNRDGGGARRLFHLSSSVPGACCRRRKRRAKY